jgi:deoxyribodipyrimidine photolyase
MSFTVHWLRKGLRLHDNPTLVETLRAAAAATTTPGKENGKHHAAAPAAAVAHSGNAVSSSPLLLVFILDPWFLAPGSVGSVRWRFLLETLIDLRKTVAGKGGRLVVMQGGYMSVLQRLRDVGMERLTFEKDYEAYAVQRDREVGEWTKKSDVKLITCSGHTLYEIDASKAAYPTTYPAFLQWQAKQPAVPAPFPTPASLPPPPTGDAVERVLSELELTDEAMEALGLHEKDVGISQPHKESPFKSDAEDDAMMEEQKMSDVIQAAAASLPVASSSLAKKKSKHSVQSTLSFGGSSHSTPAAAAASSAAAPAAPAHSQFSPSAAAASSPSLLSLRPSFTSTSYFLGGETEGLRRMEEYLLDKKAVRRFEKPKTSPTALVPSTTTLSPYLKFGCLGVREFYHALKEITDGHSDASQPPVSLIGQLMWREFFTHTAAHTTNFTQMAGNRLCKQIDWLPAGSKEEEKFLQRWTDGKTGYPFIDALMVQLKQQGWMHHLGRHAVACFLTRGDLYVSWERGRDVFDRLLVDADEALNNANWMWLSASAFFHQYWKVYSPIAFGQHTDPSGSFIRHFLPVLSKFPDKYIYQPWTAPAEVQRKAGCMVGKDYPLPIVDHKEISKVNISKHKAAYARSNAPPGAAAAASSSSSAAAALSASSSSKPGASAAAAAAALPQSKKTNAVADGSAPLKRSGSSCTSSSRKRSAAQAGVQAKEEEDDVENTDAVQDEDGDQMM